MKTEKMSFKNIKDVLSRDEMKGIMAGSGGCGVTCVSMNVSQVMNCVSGCYSNGTLDCHCYWCCSAYACGNRCV